MTKRYTLFAFVFAIIFVAIAILGLVPSMAFADENLEATPQGTATEQYIALDYLKRIEGTCFAEKVKTYVYVPVYDNHVVLVADVKNALGLTSFGVMQSYCKEIVYDAQTDVYTAVYYKSVYLNAKTVDGNYNNYYLDCNLSFEEFYSKFLSGGQYAYTAEDVKQAKENNITIKEGDTVDCQVLSSELYEYFWNNILREGLSKYDYKPSEIYGYWGFIAIPQTHTLNALWADLFDTQTTYLGKMKSFVFSTQLTWGAYQRLLTDYGYGFLEQAWEVIAGFFTTYSASFYIVYIDSEETEFMIAENNADDIDDNHGAIRNDVEDTIEDVVKSIEDLFADKGKIIEIVIVVAVVIGVLLLAKVLRKRR